MKELETSILLSERVSLLEAELRLVINNIPLLVAYIDSNLQYRIVNQTYEKFFNVKETDIRNVHISEVLGLKMFQKLTPHIEKVLNGETTKYQNTKVDPKGVERTLEGKLIPYFVSDNQQDGFLVIVEDVTEQVSLLKRITELNKSLEKKVANRTKALEEKAQELTRANEALKASEAKLINLSIRDCLTGLLNRRGWQECLANQEKREDRQLTSGSCVACLDLDKLKEINDSFGHDVGDNAIVQVAERISTFFREVDSVARLGGDEFCILFVDSTIEDIRPRMQELAESLLDSNISISWGLAMYIPHKGFEEAMRVADSAMYEMKNSRG